MGTPLKGKTKTKVFQDGELVRVQYHETDVVTATPEKITLNTGGWFMVTTKRRMNQASQQFGLDFNVYQVGGKWYVSYEGRCYDFFNSTLELKRGV